ncbi:cob(I)yrinic acid a,c-diamide adenosyltransferase [Algiphilus sp. NNCM1]|uniref:cob(I)yrinic acid a,c-diamide adenosyltransferase n=1 Tax=Algiphilus sp. TaxID=1872431 RepID=UPI001CA670E4|nr:cob(I)yrinic acid a,c-diamide adenosyltransferase [Algiphilus sp.]MBY8964280.1 cob(I)yrinic acid a,c-diamide adenosyltransferase [Algiphilus acroporae]MCI5063402.1 cob(I)yrinic acid a,c-diamide adenosyltransferase [Algiphilus sp.]MCI5103058.1 cob(I)yrinic acid a,c-diamide adenosyltransferase [Algiphilus sp.]
MGHRLSKITTRTGDGGETGLGTGARVPKTAARVVAMGEIDELNSLLGVALSHALPEPLSALLSPIQHELFDLGGELAMPGYELLGEAAVTRIEEASAQLNDTLPPLQEFVLPGGNAEAAHLHLARAVARRCERALWKLAAEEDVGQAPLAYMNRLSDLFFNAARIAARTGSNDEITWKRQGER